MFYALIGLPTLKVFATMGAKWAIDMIAKIASKALDKDEPKQADDDYVTKTKDV